MEKLKDIQAELLDINLEVRAKVYEVKLQSFQIKKPIFQKRIEIIKTIPVFWLIAFMGHPRLKQIITERDQKILAYLTSLEVRFGEGYSSAYAIVFRFDPNPYFENESLMRLYSFCDDGTIKRNCTKISWKEHMKIIKKGTCRGRKKRKIYEESKCSNDFVSWLGQSQAVTLPMSTSDEGAEEGEFEEVEHVSVTGDEWQKGEDDVRDTADI
ncbi:hypothetical protein HPP92_002764 [Vanilla planifolia]|uniref:Protein SET n=1 Tax=Vanilla planifolia TaxID=51239 RepID=A0A835SEC7_VANPL|nr:hypothetical protein HPP92_002764 [Vanilla planifolia]